MAAPTTLCTLDDLRSRLQVGEDDEQDAVLGAIREAVEERVLAMTGFTFAGGVRTEQLTDVQLGVPRTMQVRPIRPMSSDPLKAVKLEARSLASATFSDIIGDIKSEADGRIVPLASELTPIYPPVGGLSPWMRWRQMIWPVVRFTYLVDALGSPTNPTPKSLRTAAVEWVSAVYSRPAGGVVKQWTTEKVSESYIDQSMPPVVNMLLLPYVRGRSSIVF